MFLVEIPGDLEGPELSRMTVAAPKAPSSKLFFQTGRVGGERCVCVRAHARTARVLGMLRKHG